MRHDNLTEPSRRVIVDVLRRQAEHIGDDVFLASGDRTWSYGLVDDLADRHARAFAELGIGHGDTVALLTHNSAEMAVTSFGVNRLGAVWSPVSPEYRGEWLGELLSDIRSDVLVVDADLLPAIAALPALRFRHIVVNGPSPAGAPSGAALHALSDFDAHAPQRKQVHHHYGDTNAVLWTSGTTGRSKGVEQSNNTWIAYSIRHNDVFRDGVREGERFYGCVPMYNSGGWIMNIYPALVSGLTACIDKRFSVSEFWNRIRHYGAHHTMTLGTMHVYLMQQPPRGDDLDNTLRTLLMNPVIPQLVDPFKERFGVELVASGFGQSEIMGATLYRDDWGLKPGSLGVVRDDDLVETKLLDENDQEVAVGETGEICVRPRESFTIFNGYFRQPELTKQAWRNLWYHTGDLGRRDEGGDHFFVDRKKDSIRHKGRNISTFEVEHVARQFPAVAGVAAVGVKTAEVEHEEELLVCLLPAEGATIDPLEFCKFIDAKAPYFFVPRYVEIVTEFPMTPTNKIQKYKLREKGVSFATWDRTVEATDWKPTR